MIVLRAEREVRIEQTEGVWKGRELEYTKTLWREDLCISGTEDPGHLAGAQRR